MGSRIVGMISYQKEYINHLKTSLSIFYNGQSGHRVSYIYDDYNGTFTNEAYQGPELIYVPKDQNDIRLGYMIQVPKPLLNTTLQALSSRQCTKTSTILFRAMIT